jgi:Tol biopolymer transport system component
LWAWRRQPYDDVVSGRPLRFTQRAPANTTLVSGGVLSPDGRYLAFVSEDDRSGQSQLWVRALASEDAEVLVGTEGASRPFWSPDSRWIGFFANERLKILPLERGTPQTLAVVGLSPEGASWGPRGDILFAKWKNGISRIPANGGTPEALTTLDHTAQENGHTQPQFLPDGQHFLFYVRSASAAVRGTYAGTIGSSERTRISAEHAVFAPPGYLLWIGDGMLRAQRFDPDGRRLSGQPVVVATDVGGGTLLSAAGGDLVAVGGASRRARLAWFDRTGRVMGTIDTPARLHNPAFSPDLRLLMASSVEGGREGVWLVDLERGAPTRLAPHGTSPLLSPAGDRIVFTSDRRDGVSDVYMRPAGGRDEERLLLQTPENKIVNDWSPDGRYLVYVSTNATTKKDIWLLPTFGDRQPVRYLQSAFNEIQAKVSPDGRWIAYASDENGAFEVYVQSFPTPGMKQVVSVNGGAQPQWRKDGRELFYLAPDHRLMSVEVSHGTPLAVGKPRPLFRAPIEGGLNAYRSHFVPTADGQRFLIDMVAPDSHRDSIGVLVNWRALMR